MAWGGKEVRMRCVMNQLLEMERSLNNFMLETVLKLQTLTQTKVFLLLESKHYRRYGGSPEMVARFEESDFLPAEREDQICVEVELETDDILRETRKDQGRKRRSKSGNEENADRIPIVDRTLNGDSTPPKKSRLDYLSRREFQRSLEASNSSSSNAALHAGDASRFNPPSPAFIKTENDVEFSENQVQEVYDRLRLGDPLLSLRGASEHLSSSTGFLEKNAEEDDYSDGYEDAEPEAAEEEARQRALDQGVDPVFKRGMYSLANVATSQKYLELEAVDDVTLAYVKGTREFRLLGSTLYDIGKEIGYSCPTRDVETNRGAIKQYLNGKMQEYLPYFERFKHVEKRPFRDVLKTQMPESYMKNRMRCGFVRTCPNYYKSKPKDKTKSPKEKKAGKSKASSDSSVDSRPAATTSIEPRPGLPVLPSSHPYPFYYPH